MNDIKEVYKTATRTPQGGVQGYYLHNKYFDARRSREEKQLATSRERIKPMNPSPKNTFIDEVKKQAGKLPGPSTYEPHPYQRKSISNLKPESPSRLTFFDEIQKIQKKLNIPAAGTYDKIQVKPDDKVKPKSDMSKAEVCSYLQSSMRKSIDVPGVGNYHPKIQVFDRRGGTKWKEGQKQGKKRSQSERGIKAPEAATYDPAPVAYDLFGSISDRRGKSKSYFNREERFREDRKKEVPFYNIGSEWGLKDNLKKKDILSRVGSSLTHHSIYY